MESSLGQKGLIRAYTVRRRDGVTKPQVKGLREKLAQWADGVVDWIAGLVPTAPEPVPVRVRPNQPKPPRRR